MTDRKATVILMNAKVHIGTDDVEAWMILDTAQAECDDAEEIKCEMVMYRIIGTDGPNEFEQVEVASIDAPELHEAFTAWQRTKQGSERELAAWEMVLQEASNYLESADDVEAI